VVFFVWNVVQDVAVPPCVDAIRSGGRASPLHP
jgi:hypothetical protein